MDIGKFITDYTKATSPQIKEGMIKKHVVATYIPYETKMAEARNIIENSAFKTINGKRTFWIDTPTRWVLFVKDIIELYTDLVWDQTNVLLQFNLLEQYGITEKIIEQIGSDYKSFEAVLNMTLDDTLQNERSIVSYFETITDGFAKTFNEMYKGLEGEVQKYMADLIAASSEKEFTES